MIHDKALHDKCICGGTIHMKVSLDEMTDRERSNYTKRKQYFINKRTMFHPNNIVNTEKIRSLYLHIWRATRTKTKNKEEEKDFRSIKTNTRKYMTTLVT